MGAEVIAFRENPIYREIQDFIELAHHSNNTKSRYNNSTRTFFREMKGKEIEHLSADDLKIDKKIVENFRTKLKSKGKSNGTINGYVGDLRVLYNNLAENKELKLDNSFFKVIKKLPDDTDSYDPFTWSEVLTLSELALMEKNNGLEKSLFILFCTDTGIRKSSALNLTWSNFQVIDEEEVRVKGIDKGNKQFLKKIKYNFYLELLKLKSETSEKVFSNLTIPAIDKMLPRLIDKLDIKDEHRNLSFHSLRKTGVEFVYRYTGDIKAAQKHANHVDASLTLKTYVSGQDYGEYGGVSLQYQEDVNVLDQLSDKQIKHLLKNIDSDLRIRLEKQAKELFKKG